MKENKVDCDCGTVADLAFDRKSPIEHHKDLNEYNLLSGDGKTRYRMYYCFFCGGRLPESGRAGRFTDPSEEEMKEVAEVMSKIGSMEQAIRLLGKPDETVKAPKGGLEYKMHHRYLRRWKTLDLTLRERKDGSLDSAFTGKYEGESSRSTKKAVS